MRNELNITLFFKNYLKKNIFLIQNSSPID